MNIPASCDGCRGVETGWKKTGRAESMWRVKTPRCTFPLRRVHLSAKSPTPAHTGHPCQRKSLCPPNNYSCVRMLFRRNMPPLTDVAECGLSLRFTVLTWFRIQPSPTSRLLHFSSKHTRGLHNWSLPRYAAVSVHHAIKGGHFLCLSRSHSIPPNHFAPI